MGGGEVISDECDCGGLKRFGGVEVWEGFPSVSAIGSLEV